MAAPVSKDQEEAAAAALFSQLLKASDWTHETLAAALDVSPGRVSQWATNRGAIPAERAVAVASAVGTLPELISPAWRRLRAQFVSSHVERLSPEIVSTAEMVARKMAGLGPTQRLDMLKHAEFVADALRITMLKDLDMMEGADVEAVQGDGADRRFDRAAGAGKGSREAEASAGRSGQRSARTAKRA